MHINYEFKAVCDDFSGQENLLLEQNPRFAGIDYQTDTYFNVPYGRLKLREGNIENALIHYHRSDAAGARQSDVILYRHNPDASLKEALREALGVKIIVPKKRKIYFLDNIKFHFDEVQGLGNFVEVEAIDSNGSIGIQKLRDQCSYWAKQFGFDEDRFVALSYSDLLLAKKSSPA